MARNENPPFPRGGTYRDGAVTADADAADHDELLGKVWAFEDKDWSANSNVKPYRTGMTVLCMVVRNVQGSALLPKDLGHMYTGGSAYEYSGQVDSNNPSVGDLAFPIDEFLPAAGVADNDLFYVVVGGPATVRTDTAGTTTIGVGLFVIPGSGTAGRVVAQDKTVVSATNIYNQMQGAIGRAINSSSGNSQNLVINVTPKIAHA